MNAFPPVHIVVNDFRQNILTKKPFFGIFLRSLKDKKAVLCESGESHKVLTKACICREAPNSLQIQAFVFFSLTYP